MPTHWAMAMGSKDNTTIEIEMILIFNYEINEIAINCKLFLNTDTNTDMT